MPSRSAARVMCPSSDVPFLRDSDEISKVPQLHCHILNDMNFDYGI